MSRPTERSVRRGRVSPSAETQDKFEEWRWVLPALEAALGALSYGAIVAQSDGSIVAQNRWAAEVIASNPHKVQSDIAASLRGPNGPYVVVGTPCEGLFLICMGGGVSHAEGAVRMRARSWGLTSRERDVLSGVVAGKTNIAIAHHLDLSVRTIELYVGRLLRKSSARSRTQLIAAALAEGNAMAKG